MGIRTRCVGIVAGAIGSVLSCMPWLAHAQDYPTRPIRLVVAYPPGGGSDTLARIVAPRLTELTGQQVVVDNRAGAAGNIATEIAAKAQPDGYTLLWGFSTPLVVNPSLYKSLPFDTERDFAPILLLGSAQFVLVVHRSVAVSSVPELIAVLKAKPGQIAYSSAGIGSPNHLAAELFKLRANVDALHVPYKGGGPAALAVLSGEVKILFGSFASSLPHVRAGTLRALAVSGPKRSAEVPELPTLQEVGFPGFDVQAWYGVLAPARTPKAIVTRLNHDLRQILAQPAVVEGLKREGLEPSGTTPEEFAAYIRAEKALWAKVIRNAGIKPE